MAIRKSTKYIVVHVTATPPKADIGVKEVRVMHLARGFNDIGYHFVIRRDGRVEVGRAVDMVGAHVKDYNSISVGVSMVGGVDAKGKPEHNATPAQLKMLEHTLRNLTAKYPQAGVCGHRDLSPDKDGDGIIEPFEHIKACPCFDVIPWAEERGIRTAKIKGVWKKAAPAAPAPKPAPAAPAAPTPPVDTHSQTAAEQVNMTPAKAEQTTKISGSGKASIVSLLVAAASAAWAYFTQG